MDLDQFDWSFENILTVGFFLSISYEKRKKSRTEFEKTFFVNFA